MRNRKLITWLLAIISVAVVVEIVILISIISSKNQRAVEEPVPLSPTFSEARPTPEPDVSSGESATPAPASLTVSTTDALEAVSSERMLTALEDLTAIQPHSGWRGSGTVGEKEALDYLQGKLDGLDWLKGLGMTLEREHFNIFFGTEDHTSSLFLTIGTRTVEIPADATRGNRDNPTAAIRMDSDGRFNGSGSNPVEVEGAVVLIPDEAELRSLAGSNQRGNILFVNYSLVETENTNSMDQAAEIFDLQPAAIILVTKYSNTGEETHGTFVGDGGGVLQRFEGGKAAPLLFIEIENLADLGISNWDEMSSITRARVIWDTDVMNPAPSGNLVVHIPGKSAERPVLFSAHIDSPNSPGALDNGSGSVILLEIASVLNELKVQPETDLYLAWYGSEEVGLYGSTYFTTTHTELLGRLQANIQIDCLSRPLDGLPAGIMPMYSHVSTSNLSTDPFKTFVDGKGAELGLDLKSIFYEFASDNGSLSAFNIPNVNLIYQSMEMENYPGGVWVAGHLHDPYDTVKLVREMEPELLDMARLALNAALSPLEQVNFVEHNPQKRVVFLASHTEAPHMTPSGLSRFSKALINAGYVISVFPYGRIVSAGDIDGADMVVVLPAYDYPVANNADPAYDTKWTSEEAAVLNEYAEAGGNVLVVNSGNRLKFFNWVTEPNEDWADLNVLTNQWGVNFSNKAAEGSSLIVTPGSVLEGVSAVNVNPDNAVGFSLSSGEVLAGSRNNAHAAHIQAGAGEVIVLSDLSMLGDYGEGLFNPKLVQWLADWK
mgnify:CR=1 FL=1